jgi:hypothetical protein
VREVDRGGDWAAARSERELGERRRDQQLKVLHNNGSVRGGKRKKSIARIKKRETEKTTAERCCDVNGVVGGERELHDCEMRAWDWK